MTENAQQLAPGWYHDPNGAFHMRWWDGQAWTDATSPLPVPAQYAPATMASGVAAAPATPARSKPRIGKILFWTFMACFATGVLNMTHMVGSHH